MAALTEADLARAPAHRLAWRLASDDQLARAAAAGSDAAFAAIYARYHAALVRHCRGVLLDGDEAEDAAQSAMAAAMRALRGSGPQPVALRPWLYRIAHHEALALVRRRPAAGPALEDLELPAVEDAGVRERLAELLGDLRGLPERQRGALLLRELSGLRYDEIAVALETSPENARQLVSSARGALHAVGTGRATACADVRARLDDADRRALRGRALRAHLDDCADCAHYARASRARRRDLVLLFPLAPSLALLGWVGGGGAAAGGGSWALGTALGGGVAAKCAVVCATAIVGAVAVEETVERRPAPAPPALKAASEPRPEPRSERRVPAQPRPAGSSRRSMAEEPARARATTRTAAVRSRARATVSKQAVVQPPRWNARRTPARTPTETPRPAFTPDRPATPPPAPAPAPPVAAPAPAPTQAKAAPVPVQQRIAEVQQQVRQTITTALVDTQQRVDAALAAMRQRLDSASQHTTP